MNPFPVPYTLPPLDPEPAGNLSLAGDLWRFPRSPARDVLTVMAAVNAKRDATPGRADWRGLGEYTSALSYLSAAYGALAAAEGLPYYTDSELIPARP